MLILGIETSTEVCSVGLADEHGLVAERSVVESHIHSEKLLTLMADVLQSAGASPGELSAVAVSIGPGSFSGLRIGLSTAKGLCYARGIPLVAVPTMASVASSAFEEHDEWLSIVIALDAKQGEFYAGRFSRSTERITEIPVRVYPRDELVGMIRESDIVLTDVADGLQEEGERRRRVFHTRTFMSGATIALLGRQLFREERIADLQHIEPMYLKNFIVRTAKKA